MPDEGPLKNQSSAAPRLDLSLPSPGRGALLALLAIPVGVALSMALWSAGWMSSLSAFVAAALAAKLYALGAGRVTIVGAVVVSVVCAVTVVFGFVGAIWLEAAQALGGNAMGWALKADPWRLMAYTYTHDSGFYDSVLKAFWMSLLFGALGCFFTLRRLFQVARGMR